jgi:hypothetical protein
MTITYKEERITPAIAREILTHNTNNRTLRPGHAANLAADIKAGRWQVSHQGIALTADGQLLDGQHRLHAVVMAGIPITIMVARNVDPDTFKVMDMNKVRAHFDRIHLVDLDQDNKLICVVITAYMRFAKCMAGAVPVDLLETEFLTNTGRWLWAAKAFRVKRRGITLASVLAAIVSYHMDSPTKAEQFAEGLLEGVGLTPGSPVLTLREALLAGRIDTGQQEGYYKTITACRAHRDNRQLSMLTTAGLDFQGHRPERHAQILKVARNKAAATRKAATKTRRAAG